MVGLSASNVKYRRPTEVNQWWPDTVTRSATITLWIDNTQKKKSERKKKITRLVQIPSTSLGDWGVLLSCWRVSLQTSLPMKSVSLQKWTPLHFTFPQEDKSVAVRCPSLMASISLVFVLMHSSGLSSPLLQWASRLPAPRGPRPPWFPSAYVPGR